jgi:preprotein translocase subunit SecE
LNRNRAESLTEFVAKAEGLRIGAGKKMAKSSPFEYLQQVRAEGAKVTWPSRRETIVTTMMVVLMAVSASVFFLLSDQIISRVVGFILGLGR